MVAGEPGALGLGGTASASAKCASAPARSPAGGKMGLFRNGGAEPGAPHPVGAEGGAGAHSERGTNPSVARAGAVGEEMGPSRNGERVHFGCGVEGDAFERDHRRAS